MIKIMDKIFEIFLVNKKFDDFIGIFGFRFGAEIIKRIRNAPELFKIPGSKLPWHILPGI